MTEKEIIDGCRNEKRDCQTALYEQYYYFISGIALRYCQDDDEALHEVNYVFFKILKKIKKYENRDVFKAWLKRIAINHFIDLYRKNKRDQANQAKLTINIQHSVNNVEHKWNEDELLAMLFQLKPHLSIVFRLFVIDGYSHKEIAKMLHISNTNSKWRLSESRRLLKIMLSKDVKNVKQELNRDGH